MAVTKPSLPNPAAFTSDPIESVYAHQLPQLGGLAYMFLNAAQDKREMGQQDYMKGVDKANAMSFALGRLEEEQKLKMEREKLIPSLIGHGILPSSITNARDVLSNIGSADAETKTIGDLRRAQAQEAMMKGANSGGEKVSVQSDVFPFGDGGTRVTVKGANADSATSTAQAQAARIKAQLQAGNPAPTPQNIDLMRRAMQTQ